MSQGDNLVGIPTIYKGVKMRSILETKVAMFLDALNIKWIYEPKCFMLSTGILYKPDYWLPELKQWLEVKGDIKEHNKEISKIFVQDNHTTLILISPQEVYWYSYLDGNYHSDAYSDGQADTCEAIQIGLCPHCKKYFFCDMYGSWHCRNCKKHEGDSNLFSSLGKDSWHNDVIDFSNVNSIKDWLNTKSIRIF